MTDPVIPAAPVVPAAPAAPAPAAPAPTPSLIDTATPPAAAAPPAAAPPAAAPPPAPPAEWFYADGVKGVGAKPDWFKDGKYKTLEQQAKAYPELEKRLGSFVGAPEGEYAVNIPEQYKGAVDVDTTHPVFAKLGKWARDAQLSQEGYNQVIGLLSEYEASAFVPPPTIEDAKKAIGANADVRLQSIGQYAGASLDAASKAALSEVLVPANPFLAKTVAAFEALIAKSRQPVLPKPGDGGQPPPVGELEAINAMQAAIDPKTGKRFYEQSQDYRHDVEKRRREFFAKQKAAA